MRIAISRDDAAPPGARRTEIVERKGLGHPDSICDAIAEELSLELSAFYQERLGVILHHNVDKALLVAGSARPRFGGGSVTEPIQLFLAGRATLRCDGVTVPVDELAGRVARRWLEQSLRALDPERHVRTASLVRPGSSELVALYDARRHAARPLANDTSCGVGFAPWSQLEGVVFAVEQALVSPRAHALAPALGEDVKVMGVRYDDQIELTVACAMIDGALGDASDYERARQTAVELAAKAATPLCTRPPRIEVNVGDDPGASRFYLTVTGTSAEAGDDGQAGRGNRCNGLITPGRPMTIESVAGKNPVTHVGKLYNLVATRIAERVVSALGPGSGAEVRLVSRIGQPIDEPALLEVSCSGTDVRASDADLREQALAIARDELSRLPGLAQDLVQRRIRAIR